MNLTVHRVRSRGWTFEERLGRVGTEEVVETTHVIRVPERTKFEQLPEGHWVALIPGYGCYSAAALVALAEYCRGISIVTTIV